MCAMRSSDYAAGLQIHYYGLTTQKTPTAQSDYAVYWPGATQHWNRMKDRQYWFKVRRSDDAEDFAKIGWWGPCIQGVDPMEREWSFSRYQHNDPASNLPIKEQKYTYNVRNNGGQRNLVATGAIYNTAVNPKASFVIAQWFGAPKMRAEVNWGRQGLNPPDPVREDELPGLRHFSDFLWYEWVRAHGSAYNLQPPRTFGVMQVGDAPSMMIIARLLLKKGIFDLEEWPALNSVFSMDTEEGLALLGKSSINIRAKAAINNLVAAPAGMIVAEFLIQHKKGIGLQHVTSVKVFRGAAFEGGKRNPQLLFQIAPVPQEQQKADPPPGWVPPPEPVRPVPQLPWERHPDAPGPSTPRAHEAQSTPRAIVPKDSGVKVSYDVNHEADGDNIIRTHTFHFM
jgi:hypothetical protein